MIKEIRDIFQDLQENLISIAEAEQFIIDLWEESQPSTECNCCYMTTGEHSDSCPKRLFI